MYPVCVLLDLYIVVVDSIVLVVDACAVVTVAVMVAVVVAGPVVVLTFVRIAVVQIEEARRQLRVPVVVDDTDYLVE